MNQLKTVLLLGLLGGLFVVAGGIFGGKTGVIIALIFALGMNFFAYWWSDKIVLRMYGAEEVTEHDDPEFYYLVKNLADKAGLPMPRVYMIPDESPNAFATGRDPQHAAVAATMGARRILSREELAGVISHELAHVKNRDILIQTIAATIGAAITGLAHMAQWAFLLGGRSDEEDGAGSLVGTLLLVFLAPFAAMLIQFGISRSREYLADQTGAEICGHPLWLASALDKLRRGVEAIPMHNPNEATAHMFIVSPLTGGGLAALFSTHPPLEERIARLQAMAGY